MGGKILYGACRVAHWLSAGFQAKEAKKQLSLWSEPVLKGLSIIFGNAGHAAQAKKTHVRMNSHKE